MFLISISFVWISMHMGILSRNKGPEAGGTIWWADKRLMHALLYLNAAYYLYHDEHKVAGLLLLSDVSIGTFLRYDHRLKRSP